MLKLLCLDEGHGVSFDRGADGRQSGGCLEEDIINKLSNVMKVHLRNMGQPFICSRPPSATSENDSLNQRVKICNINKCDYMLSLHANKTIGGTGIEIYTYKGKQLPEAIQILQGFQSMGFYNRGIKQKELAVVDNTKPTAMLIEICFCDNPNDVALFEQNIDKIARLIISAVTHEDITLKEKPKYTMVVSTDNKKLFENTFVDLKNKGLIVSRETN